MTGAEKDHKDEDDIVRDGQAIRRPMLLMDGLDDVQRAIARASDKSVILDHHRPGFRSSDADTQRRQSLYAEHDRRLCDAWKTPSSDPSAVKEAAPIKVVDYASYDRRVSEAWRSA